MAQKTIVIVEDDLGGGAADESVTFALDGVTYEIDLSEANARTLRDALSRYVTAGRRVGGARRIGGSASARTDKEQLDAMRRWARRTVTRCRPAVGSARWSGTLTARRDSRSQPSWIHPL